MQCRSLALGAICLVLGSTNFSSFSPSRRSTRLEVFHPQQSQDEELKINPNSQGASNGNGKVTDVVSGVMALLSTFVLALALASPAEAEWSHTSSDSWSKEFPMCSAQMQSPIDITTSNLLQSSDRLSKYTNYKAVSEREIKHNGHVMQVDGAFGTLQLPDGEYQVKQFHFHFPAEHRVDGQLDAGEMHIVHQKKGSSGTNDLAVIGVILRETNDPSMEDAQRLKLLGFGSDLPQVGQAKEIQQPVDLNAFTKELSGGFYHYVGSLTTPPCAEGVHWYVAKEKAPVTKDMIRSFKERFSEDDNRPTQPKNGRKVVQNTLSIDQEF